VKVAMDFPRSDGAVRRKSVALTRRSRLKADRLQSGRTLCSRQKPGLRDSKLQRPNGWSLPENVRLAQQGDAEAFEIIYQQHGGRVYALCLRMLRDPVEAEDLVQEVFMLVFRKIHTFRGDSAFSTWLHRLTTNLVLMRLRRKKPMCVSLDEIMGSEERDAKPHQEIGGPDPRLSGLADRINLQSAIDQLPQGYREIFILYDVQGYEHSEIAKILGRSIGNSKSQLHKARKRLRELLQRVQNYRARQNRETARQPLAFVASH
jgi:RNA polymerase sigma-70 factor (ECF subfamily)